MRPSLLHIRRRLKPLVWLMLGALLPAFSPHLAQGVVLCIGEGHVAVESVQADHHDGDEKQASRLASSSLASSGLAPMEVRTVPAAPVIRDIQRGATGDAPCTDVPIRITRAADTCHQAVQVDTPGAEALSAGQPVASLDLDLSTRSSRPVFSSDEATASSSRPLSTVVLLI